MGRRYDIQGTGILPGLGLVHMQGSLQTPGLAASSHVTGTIVLSVGSDYVVLQVTGATLPGLATLPTHLQYTVVGGTGPYTSMHASGALGVWTSGIQQGEVTVQF